MCDRKNSLRTIRAEIGFLSRAHGSCAIEQGKTVIWSSVNGPSDCTAEKRLENQLYIDVIYNGAGSDEFSRKMDMIIGSVTKQIIDRTQYPMLALTISVFGLQMDGSEVAAALTSVCLALMDNGVAMNGVFCGIMVASIKNQLLLDPAGNDLLEADAKFTFAFRKDSKGIERIASYTEGCFEYETYENAAEFAKEASNDVFVFYREAMQSKLIAGMM